MTDRRHLLKIKLKSLAAEAKIIRKAERALAFPPSLPINHFSKEERDKNPDFIKRSAVEIRRMKAAQRARFRSNPWYGQNRETLSAIREHRVIDVREEARATHLAYGFVRGKTYQQIEGNRQLRHCGDGLLAHDENRVIEKALRLAWFYGPTNKVEAQELFKAWLEVRTVSLASPVDASLPTGFALIGRQDVVLPDSGGTALSGPSTP